jgi:hypothetical protein
MKPPKFDGKTCLDEFVIAFQNCAVFNRWSREEKTAHLKNSLAGIATQLLRDSADNTYEQLIEKLERRFGTKNQQERYRTEIRCRRRKKDEPLTELAESIRGLMMLAYPGDQTASTNEVVARDAFLTALNDADLEEEIRRREPKDLDEACKMALRFEVIKTTVRTEVPAQRGHHARQVNEQTEESEEQTPGGEDSHVASGTPNVAPQQKYEARRSTRKLQGIRRTPQRRRVALILMSLKI